MSYTELYVMKKDGELAYTEFRNAFRGAMYVWTDVAQRYAGFDSFPFNEKDQMEVWNYDRRHPGVMKHHEIIVLLSTMDYALVDGSRWKNLVEDFEQYGTEHPNSNYMDQAKAIRQLVEEIGEDNVKAFAWNQTSVGEAWCVTYDDEGDENVFYDPDTENKHFWVYELSEEEPENA